MKRLGFPNRILPGLMRRYVMDDSNHPALAALIAGKATVAAMLLRVGGLHGEKAIDELMALMTAAECDIFEISQLEPVFS
jgi:hypothetical protein